MRHRVLVCVGVVWFAGLVACGQAPLAPDDLASESAITAEIGVRYGERAEARLVDAYPSLSVFVLELLPDDRPAPGLLLGRELAFTAPRGIACSLTSLASGRGLRMLGVDIFGR